MLTRRSFVGSMGAAAANLAVTEARQAPYRIGIETWCFHDVDLPTMLKHVGGLGIEYLELHDDHLKWTSSPAEIARAQRLMQEAGITPVGVYIHDAYTEDEQVTRRIFDYARQVGFSYITGGPTRESLPVVNRLVREYRIDVAIHNHGPGAQYETLEDVTRVLEAHPSLTAVIDIGHFARSRVDPVNATRVLSPRAVAIHVKDIDAKGENMVVGEGTLDVPGVFRTLRESGFKGLVVLEYEGDFDDMERRLAGMRKSLANMQRFIEAAARR